MLLSRDELIVTLLRETDRAQRMKTPLALILCGLDAPIDPGSPLDARARNEMLREIVARITRLLRCYDSVGQMSEREFALVLPGCNSFNAVSMAERFNAAVVGSSVSVGGMEIFLTACFGVAGGGGRSSLVVLRNAEQALKSAWRRGAGTIERCSYDAEADSRSFAVAVIEDKAVHG